MNPTARRFGVTARDSASDSERVLAEGVSAAMTIPDVVKDVRGVSAAACVETCRM